MIRRVCFIAVLSAAAWCAAQARPTSEPARGVDWPAPRPATTAVERPASQPATGPTTRVRRPPSSVPTIPLGERFESRGAGVAFRPPANLPQLPSSGIIDNVVVYADTKARASLSVTRIHLLKSLSLLPKSVEDPATKKTTKQPGLLDLNETQLAGPPLNGTVLRKDIIRAGRSGGIEIGMLVARYTLAQQRFLRQQAFVRYTAGQADPPGPQGTIQSLMYFLLDYTTPSGQEGDDQTDADPDEQQAVETFARVLDTIEIFDLAPIARDADERLYRTRTLLLNATRARVEAKLLPQQVYLITQDAKEIGYSFVAEEVGVRDGLEGAVVAIRTRTYPKLMAEDKNAPGDAAPKPAERPKRIDALSEMFCTFDRKYEVWASVLLYDLGPQGVDQTREFGSAKHVSRRVFGREIGDDGNPKFRIEEKFSLNVTQFTKGGNQPMVEREVPPYYLPQAFAHLLPRLLPLTEYKTYLFCVWVGPQREVIRRYVDVEQERKVELGGRTMLACPVSDRIGLEGAPTHHYFAPDGRYLGSVTPGSKLAVTVSTPEAVKRLWPDADLTPPQVLKAPEKERP